MQFCPALSILSVHSGALTPEKLLLFISLTRLLSEGL